MKKFTLMLALASAFLVASCSKDDDNNNGGGGTPAVTNTSKLCNKDWKIEAVRVGGFDVTTQFLQPCQLDNLTRFLTDGTVNNDEGPTKCDPADPQTSSGTWAFADNETKLVLDGDTANLLVNSGSVLKIGISDPTIGNIEVEFGL